MKTTKLIVAALAIGSVLSSCKKPADQTPPADSTAMAKPAAVDSAKMMAAEWDKFKSESEQKIKSIEDSLVAYDAKMKKLSPEQKKMQENVKARSAALRARLAQKPDEAAGSWKRAGDAISGGIDSLGDMVKAVVNPSSKKK